MSPDPNIFTDRQSVKTLRRGRPSVPRELVLRAAEALFADTPTPSAISMEDIAVAAGVGKGTLFRAFGSRGGLLDAMFAARLDPLRAEVERPGSALGPDRPPIERVLAILDYLLTFKLDNARLTTAREMGGASLLQAPHYRWVHDLLAGLIEEGGSTSGKANYSAHVLLGSLRTELIMELLSSGTTVDELRKNLIQIAKRVSTEPGA